MKKTMKVALYKGMAINKELTVNFIVTYETKEQQEIVKQYLTDLYNKGLVRYASW